MTVETSKLLIRRWYDAWQRGDLTSLDGLFAQDYSVNERTLGIEG